MKLLHGHGRYQSGRVLRGHGLTGTAIEALATGMTLASVKGVWLDPSDTGTLYQDAAGTTPVTAPGQTVGLILDKFSWGGKTLSQVLAGQAELVTNGGFDSDTAWTKGTGWTISGGQASNSGLTAGLTQSTLTAGLYYLLEFDLVSVSNWLVASIGGAGNVSFTSPGRKRMIARANGASLRFDTQVDGHTATIDNVTVKHIPGHHASQSDAAKKPKYRRGDSRGVVNLLTWSQDFANAAWSKSNASVTASSDFDKIVENTATGIHEVSQSPATFPSGLSLSASIDVKAGERTWTHIYIKGVSNSGIYLNLATGAVGTVQSAVVSHNVEENADGSYRISWSAVTTATASFGVSVLPANGDGGASYTGDGTSGIYVRNAQLEQASTASAYQRVDASLGGIPTGTKADLHWLEFDGVDDFLSTAAIDFTGSDEMTVVAGLRKLSDAAGTVAELSASFGSNAGSYYLRTGDVAGTNDGYVYASRGDAPATAAHAAQNDLVAAPHTAVMSGLSNISADTATLRMDGSQAAQATEEQGLGNFGSYPLYIGMRGGASLPFKGWLYGMFIGAKVLDASQLSVAEKHHGKKAARAIA